VLSLSRKWITIILLVTALKVLLSAFAVVVIDFSNFMQMAQHDFLSLSQGNLPFNGFYTGMGIFLSAFYGFWLALPIDHANEILLILAMKTPVLIFDFLVGVLIYFVTQAMTGSTPKARKGFLIWYLNPYNILLVDMWGSVDIIPAALLLLTILLAYKGKWFFGGLSLAVASILRLFPILLVPAVLLHALRKGRIAITAFLTSYVAPLACASGVLIGMLGSVQTVVGSFADLALKQPFLIFYGYSLLPDIPSIYNLRLALFMFAVQLYVMARFWKTQNASLLSPSLAFLLILFAATSQQIYHFNWVTPLLTVDYVMNLRRPRLFPMLFASAFLVWFSGSGLPRPDWLLLFPSYTQGVRAIAESVSLVSPILRTTHILFPGIFAGLTLCSLLDLNARSMRIPA
jgi:hypothetical protein